MRACTNGGGSRPSGGAGAGIGHARAILQHAQLSLAGCGEESANRVLYSRARRAPGVWADAVKAGKGGWAVGGGARGVAEAPGRRTLPAKPGAAFSYFCIRRCAVSRRGECDELHRDLNRAWTFMPADLAGENAPRHRTFSKILGSGDP